MEELVDDEGLDVEALQAQIELSLAHTQNLVSSWLKPGGSDTNFPKATRRDEEQEIQELLKRPPRLGVGAPVPASTGVLGREAVKLKGKLVGKKRGREMEDSAIAPESEGEEESRAGAIKKKARVDPFSQGNGKGKKKQKVAEEEPAIHPLLKSTVQDKNTDAKDRTPDPERPEEDVSDDPSVVETPTSSPKKKKKKKEHRSLREGTPVPAANEHIVTASFDSARAGNEFPVAAPANSSPKSPTQPLISGIPLLNLDGPPPALSASPAKKKRKRNKKKKKKQALESDGPTAVAPEDDEDDV